MSQYNNPHSPQTGVPLESTEVRHYCGSADVDAGAGEGVGDDADDSRSASAVMYSNQGELCLHATEGNDCSVHGVEIQDL